MKPLLDKHRAAVQPKQAPPSQPSSKTATKESAPPPAQSSPPKADPPSKKGKQTASKKTTTTTAAAKGGGGEEDGAPLVLVAHAKEQRIKNEDKLKVRVEQSVFVSLYGLIHLFVYCTQFTCVYTCMLYPAKCNWIIACK